MINFPESYPNIFCRRWPARALAADISRLNVSALIAEYHSLRNEAPRRSKSGKPYFAGHSGMPSTVSGSNRLEEHMAMALLNLDRFWPLPPGGWFRLLDYQVPLKAAQDEDGIGKIDLLGVSNRGRLVIVELKMRPQAGGRSDSPPAALMEALRYAAMVQGDQAAIRAEVNEKFGAEITLEAPIVLLLAPAAWWRAWIDLPAAGAWHVPFSALVQDVQKHIGVAIECVALSDSVVDYAAANRAPRFKTLPDLRPLLFERDVKVGDALALPAPDHQASEKYSDKILGPVLN